MKVLSTIIMALVLFVNVAHAGRDDFGQEVLLRIHSYAWDTPHIKNNIAAYALWREKKANVNPETEKVFKSSFDNKQFHNDDNPMMELFMPKVYPIVIRLLAARDSVGASYDEPNNAKYFATTLKNSKVKAKKAGKSFKSDDDYVGWYILETMADKTESADLKRILNTKIAFTERIASKVTSFSSQEDLGTKYHIWLTENYERFDLKNFPSYLQRDIAVQDFISEGGPVETEARRRFLNSLAP